jgi:hypothetical protein
LAPFFRGKNYASTLANKLNELQFERFFPNSSGVDVMITIFCNFRQFSPKKLAFFSKTDVMITILHNLPNMGPWSPWILDLHPTSFLHTYLNLQFPRKTLFCLNSLNNPICFENKKENSFFQSLRSG